MVNFGIVGLGRIGKVHLSNVQRYFTNARVIAACSNENKHEEFLKEHGVNLYFDSSITLAKKFSLRGIPTSILINKNGFEFARIVGSIDFKDEEFIKWLSKYN